MKLLRSIRYIGPVALLALIPPCQPIIQQFWRPQPKVVPMAPAPQLARASLVRS